MRKLLIGFLLLIPALAYSADSDIVVSSGTGTSVDTRTVGSTEHRQVIVIGDPSAAPGVAPVDSVGGLRVNLGTSTAVIGTVLSTVTVSAIQQALPAGTNAIGKLSANSGVDIGDVDVASIAAGDNNIGNVDVVTMPTVTVISTVAVSAIQQPLPAGTNAIGKLSANSGVDIGDVDVTSIASGDNNIGNVDVLTMPTVTVITTATVTRIQEALPTGTNSIGQVTANAGTNLNTSLLALESGGNLATAVASLSVLDDWDETDRAKVNPISGQAGVAGNSGNVGATTQRVVLATDQPALTNPLLVNHGLTSIAVSSAVVATAGTAVAIRGSQAAKEVIITARSNNTGTIVVGNSAVVAAIATRQGVPLEPGDSIVLEVDNLSEVFIDSTQDSDAVSFIYLN